MKPFLSVCVLFCMASAQPAAVQDFDFIVQKVETNYAGFSTKVTDSTRPAYQSLTQKTREQLAGAKAEEVDALLKTWLDFFKDKHLSVARPPTVEGVKPPDIRPVIDETAMRKSWAQRNHALLEGIWENENYRIAIVPEGKSLVGIILSSQFEGWKPGFIKLTIPEGFDKVRLVRADYAVQPGPVKVLAHGAGVDLAGAIYQRIFPPLPAGSDVDRLIPPNRFFWKKISPRTALLRLPTFHHAMKAELDKLLPELPKTENLVIDLRDNGGGSDITYAGLMPYIYTRPIFKPGYEILSTPDNIENYEEIVQDPLFPKAEKPRIQSIVKKLRAAPGAWVEPDERDFDIRTFPEILPHPKRIGILISGCGSSAENFVMEARQSRKVTTFGSPSGGVIDFGNVHALKTPGGLELRYPTTRSLRLPEAPVDNIGLQADIPIDPAIDDPIALVQLWLERQSD